MSKFKIDYNEETSDNFSADNDEYNNLDITSNRCYLDTILAIDKCVTLKEALKAFGIHTAGIDPDTLCKRWVYADNTSFVSIEVEKDFNGNITLIFNTDD